MSRSYMMRCTDDDDYYTKDDSRLVHAKPIEERLLRKLGSEFGQARDL
jgi:hypothetical protein